MTLSTLLALALVGAAPADSPCCCAGSACSALNRPIAPTEVIRPFNGQNLDGLVPWLTDTKYEDPRHVFTVEKGMLHISGNGLGYIRTKQYYKNYHLILEFRWGGRTWGKRVDRARDSGVIVHCVEPDGSLFNIFMAGIEAQMIEGGTGDFIVCSGKRTDGSPITASLTAEMVKDRDGERVWHAGGPRETIHGGRINWYGRDVDWKDAVGYRGREDLENPVGQWNRLEVICDGRRIEQRLNGVKCNEGFDADPSSGPILIQTELAEVYVRRFELWPLGKAPQTPAGWKDK
jgi:hypothetical protein